MAVLQDPTGALFAVWEARRNIGLGVIDEPGAFCWAELVAKDLPRCATFYKSLFGWGTKDDPRYTEWTLGDRSIGGMIQIQKDWGDVPPHWLVYFQVDDCDASAAKAKGLGATVTLGPQDFPGVGRIALVSDPQGASFYVIKLTGLGH
jgi:predicted enzyme related to lactoylglutathione lyase